MYLYIDIQTGLYYILIIKWEKQKHIYFYIYYLMITQNNKKEK